MAREDWRDPRDRDDFGQADYSSDYGYDPQRRTGYRIGADRPPARDDYGQADPARDERYDPSRQAGPRPPAPSDPTNHARGPERSWMDRAGDFFTNGRDPAADPARGRPQRRRGPSDRVLWTVIVQRLEDERHLDLRDIDVIVEDGEVTLNGTVRRREDKRRIEDVAEIDGVRHVQNNLRVRERPPWSFI